VFRSILLSILSSILFHVFASDVFVIRDEFSHADLTKYMYIVQDKNATLNADDVLFDNAEIKKMLSGSLGYLQYPIWTKLTIKNESNSLNKILLANPKPSTDMLYMYIYKQNVLISKQIMGHSYTNQKQDISSRYQAIELKISPNETVDVITKIESKKAIEAGWVAVTQPLFMAFSMYDYLLWGVFGGFILALVFYNTSMYFSVKDTAYVAYIVHAMGLLIFQYTSNGILHETSLFSQKIIDIFGNILPNLGAAAYITFQVLFFDTKKNMPTIHKLLLAAIAINILLCLCVLYESDFIYLYRIKFGGIFYLYMLIVSAIGCLIAFKKQLDGALYYILGQGMFALLNAYHTSPVFLKNDTSFLTTYAIVVGVLFDVVFLSLALSTRVGHIKREKENKERLLLSQSRFAAIGSVIGNISHQWKVPLTRMSGLIMEMEAILFKSRGKFNIEQKDIVGNMRNCLNFMDESIREFNEFYSSDRTKTNFYPAKEIEGVIQLLSAKTLFAEAEIVRHMDEYITIKGHKNAFANICMILLDNALDIFKAREISRGIIFVELFLKNDGNTILKVSDNGGGIKVKPIDSIFNVFMNSEKEGSGLGLAMAKVLVEQKLNGRIKAYNDGNKAIFEIEFGA